MKVLVIFGTRPEVIKLAPVIFELRRRRVQTVVCATGQHRDLLPQAMDIFGIVPLAVVAKVETARQRQEG
jgi:UDP-N-acetylglucosamine 2-epimerase (non-hydrolysing)